MNIQEKAYFDALVLDRTQNADVMDKRSMRGLRQSVSEKYSDQAHFIYELLQNANDAKATTARFALYSDRLIFVHNGTKRFTVSNPETEDIDTENRTLGDLNSITSYANSNKYEASIGKFGVGFKSVFQYTATPHIYDPDLFFRLDREIVPSLIEADYPDRKPDETLFIFPFDHAKRTAAEAFEDISEKLRNLNYPLLFLTEIKDISFEMPGLLGLYGKSISRVQEVDNTLIEFICLTQNDGDDLYDDKLWLFSRETESGHSYSVGFFVDENESLTPKQHTAFCFFPTKETTGLNFIFHAPFLLTDSREGIRAGVPHNKIMIDLLAELAADSLVYLRDIGISNKQRLITDDIFNIIPYDETVFNDKSKAQYKQFYILIKKRMETDTLLPTADSYVSSENAHWAERAQTVDIFTDTQLALLVGNENAKWVFISLSRAEIQRANKPLDNYADDIVPIIIEEDDIINGFSYDDGTEVDGITASFIEAQPIKWLHRFYKWISETTNRTKIAKDKPIFLNQKGKAVPAFDEKGQAVLFLPTDGDSNYATVNETLLKDENTLAFFKQLGISEPSLRDEVYNKILPLYKDGVALNTRPHFKKFFRYFQDSSQAEAKSFLSLIREHAFLLYKSESDETQYRGAAETLYFPSENLKRWFQSKPETKFVSFDEYLEIVGKKKREELVEFLSALGVKDTPRVISRELTWIEAREIQTNWPSSSRGQKWIEKHIDGCKELIETIIEEQNIESSNFLWMQLLKFVQYGFLNNNYWSRDSVLFGRYEYFYRSSQSKHYESHEAIRLRTLPWIVNKDGVFVSAKELTIQKLNSQYDLSCDEAIELLRLLEIEDAAVAGADENEGDISTLAESLGLSDEEQRQALVEYAKRKKATESSAPNDNENDEDSDEKDDEAPDVNPSISRVIKDIKKRAVKRDKEQTPDTNEEEQETENDEDEYVKPTVDYSKKIEQAKQKSAKEIERISQLEMLAQKAAESERYTYGWFKALLELEALNSGENNPYSKEISISFAKVEREPGATRTLILKHPSRYIPQSMEDLANIPLELHFHNDPLKKVEVEVVSVKSYTLRAKLRTNAEIEGVDLSLVREAKIEAKNPVFLLEELKKAFLQLDYENDFDMQENLCENIEFVFGPPGTGKTTHLATDVILPIMRNPYKDKVLVLTPTNKAADVLVSRIMEVMGEDHSYKNWLIRFGTTNDNVIEQSGVFRDKTFDIRTMPKNVTVTTIARFPYDFFMPDDGTRLHLDALKWDYIIVDEASMIPLVNIIYPLYKKTPEKFIIAGDPFQIEPITSVDQWKDENIYTMVELKSFTDPTTIPHPYHVELLTTQYRSIPTIGEIFSNFAYGGVLEHNRFEESQVSLGINEIIGVKSVNIVKFPVSKYESIYRPKKLKGKSNYQVYSAIFTFEFVRHLSKWISTADSKKQFKIGVIAPYRAQSDLIDKLMMSATLPKNIDVQVGTIHGFQGDECEIIISVFNPPPSITKSPDMFLNKRNIINVSISRARDYIFIIMPDDDAENVNNLTLIKQVEKLCKKGDYAFMQTADIEEIIWGNDTYIEDNSFSTSHQMVNVYGEPERRYEVRSENDAVDVQIHDITNFI